MLALIHTPCVADPPAQIRRLRDENGVIDDDHRPHSFSLWAGNVQRPRWFPPLSQEVPRTTSRPMRQVHNRACIAARDRQLELRQSYIQLAVHTAATSWLHSGDVVARVTFVPGLDGVHTGICERRGAALAAIHAAAGHGVICSGKFVRDVSGVQGVIGGAFVRPCAPLVSTPVTLAA